MQWLLNIRKWLKGPKERRASPRCPGGALVAYYWTGGPPAPCRVRDISEGGAYIQTPDLWAPGTVITLTIQRAAEPGAAAASDPGDADHLSQTLHCDVMRREPAGFSVRFLFLDRHQKQRFQEFMRGTLPPGFDAPAQGEDRPVRIYSRAPRRSDAAAGAP